MLARMLLDNDAEALRDALERYPTTRELTAEFLAPAGVPAATPAAESPPGSLVFAVDG